MMSEAPKTEPITLYLPGAKLNEHGKPVTAAHLECVGSWDAKHSRWIDKQNNTVYPSQWAPLS